MSPSEPWERLCLVQPCQIPFSPPSLCASSQPSPLGIRIPSERLDGRCSRRKKWELGPLWAGSRSISTQLCSAEGPGWVSARGMAEPGDGALEAPGICCSVCLPLPCCFPGMPPSICPAAPLEKQRRWLVGAPGRRRRKSSWEVHRVSPLSFPPRHCLST